MANAGGEGRERLRPSEESGFDLEEPEEGEGQDPSRPDPVEDFPDLDEPPIEWIR